MLDQIIYTECNPQRDLLHGGKIVRKNGYGVFSMSKEIFSNKKIKNYNSLYDLLMYTNCSKEKNELIGTFGSYIYINVPDNVDVFMFDYGRPHCKNPLKERLHRSGIHIKQCLVGTFEDYPCSWFGSPVWNAHTIHEDNYYVDDVVNFEPPFLDQLPSRNPAKGYLSFENVREFVKSERSKLLAAAVAFVFAQMKLPPHEQKVLLIKDLPQNVELWIAAISFCFPECIAQRITFNTNISNLGSKIESRLFYTSDSGSTGGSVDPENQKRSPYFMIAGFHPHDESSANFRQYAASRFVILDGKNNKFDYEIDGENRAYYQAVRDYRSDLWDFCRHILPALSEKGIVPNIPDYFDAYQYLLDTSQRIEKDTYEKTLLHMQTITKFGLSDPELSQRFLDNCLNSYDSFSDADRQSNYPLLMAMSKLAKLCHREKDVTACIADGIQDTINQSYRSGVLFSANWEAIRNSVLSELIQPILCEILNDTELERYYKKFPQSDPTTVETMMDMFFTMLKSSEGGIESVFKSKVRMTFLYQGVLALTEHEDNLMRVLSKVLNSEKMMDFLIYNIGRTLIRRKPQASDKWFDLIVDKCNVSCVKICQLMCQFPDIKMEKIEEFLAGRVRKNKNIDSTIITALNHSIKKLGADEKTGIGIFEEVIKYTSVRNINTIIVHVQKCTLSPEAYSFIFDKLDDKLLSECFNKELDDMIFDSIYKWSIRLKKTPRSTLMWEFGKVLERADTEQKMLDAVARYSKYRIRLTESFIREEGFQKIVEKTEKFLSGHVHLAVLTMFEANDKEALVNTYIGTLMERNVKLNPEKQLLSVCSAGVMRYKIPDCADEYVIGIQKIIMASLEYQLPKYSIPNLESKVAKSRDFDKQIREVLAGIIRNNNNGQKKSSGIGKLFNNMFNRDKN